MAEQKEQALPNDILRSIVDKVIEKRYNKNTSWSNSEKNKLSYGRMRYERMSRDKEILVHGAFKTSYTLTALKRTCKALYYHTKKYNEGATYVYSFAVTLPKNIMLEPPK